MSAFQAPALVLTKRIASSNQALQIDYPVIAGLPNATAQYKAYLSECIFMSIGRLTE
jgi:hypothetical protein